MTSPDEAAGHEGRGARPAAPPITWPRVRAAIVLLSVVVVVPIAVAGLLGGWPAIGGAVLGVIGVFLVATQSGRARVPWFVIGTCPLLALVVPAVGTIGWVLALALLAAAAGLASHRRLSGPFAAAGVVVSAAGALDPDALALGLGAYALAGIWAYVALGRFGLPEVVPREEFPLPVAAVLGLLLGVVAGAAGALSIAWSRSESFYLPLFVFLLVMPAVGATVSDAARLRVWGTLLAVVIAVPLGIWPLPLLPRVVLAFAMLVVMVAAEGRLALQAAASALAVILCFDPSGRGTEVGGTRLLSVLVAAGLVAGVLAVAGVVRHRERHVRTHDGH